MGGKNVRAYLVYFVLSCLLMVSCVRSRQASGEVSTRKDISSLSLNLPAAPVFQSSFIQYWYCQNFDSERWKKELLMLKKLGINEIILQTTADTRLKHAVYDTSIEGYTHNDIDMIKNVLTQADLLSINVRIGIGFNDEWWQKRATDPGWLKGELEANRAIIDEITVLYGQFPSFTGWYIPHEFCQFTAITGGQQANLNKFFRQIAAEIKSKSPDRDIMISPFYYGKLSLPAVLPLWSNMLINILGGTGIDILALQDSVGVHYNSTSDLQNLFSYTKLAAGDMGMRLYSVTETFVTVTSSTIPAPQMSIIEQLSLVKEYVEGFVAFSINHFQNSNEALQIDNFREYQEYYLENESSVPME